MEYIRAIGIMVLVAITAIQSYWEIDSIPDVKTGVVDWFQVRVIVLILTLPIVLCLGLLSLSAMKSQRGWPKLVGTLGLSVGVAALLLSGWYLALGAYHYYS
jgi:hypothetical protein